MGQVSAFLRRATNGYGHWCPGCGQMHIIPDRWTFNGNIERPTFSPSVRISGKKIVVDASGRWTGEWERDASGKTIDYICHYFLVDGELRFCADSTHGLAGKNVPLPSLPEGLRD